MKISKAWCGLFSAVGTGLGLSAYLAQQGSSFCYSTATNMINAFLDADINLSGLNTTITIQSFPHPLQISLGDLSFNLRRALSSELVTTLQNLPAIANEACKDVIWEQGAIVLLVCASVGGLGIYAYNKLTAHQKALDKLEEPDLETGYAPINHHSPRPQSR